MAGLIGSKNRPEARRRMRREGVFRALCSAAIAAPLVVLMGLVAHALGAGWPRLDIDTNGLAEALLGSVGLIGIAALVALPVGVGAAIYLEELAGQGRLARLLAVNVANLAAVPSIVYGLVGAVVFVRTMGLGEGLAAGGVTLGLLALPLVVLPAREALRAVPNDVREASYALGASRFQTIRHAVLPAAAPSILTGCILAVSRALGEAAPILVLGAVISEAARAPGRVPALPAQIYRWLGHTPEHFHANAAAAVLMLLVAVVVVNGGALVWRARIEARSA